MASLASSDPFVLFAWATGLASLALSGALTLQVVRVRHRATDRARRRAEFLDRWRPILYDAALGGSPALPRLDPADEDAFLGLWNEVQEALHGDSRAALNAVAEAVGAAAAARRLAEAHGVSRAQALRTVGHLGRREDYPLVLGFLDDRLAYLSLIAARALVRIDPERAPGDVVLRLATRDDWPVSLLLTALAGAPPGALAAALRAACVDAPTERLVRAVPLAELLDEVAAEEFLRRALAASPRAAADPEVIAAVLRQVRSPRLADVARAGCAHPAWAVRTQAAAALGRVGEPGDRERLLPLLTDPQWWVRYRAAQALAAGRLGPPAALAPLVEGLNDRYARDILAHVLAERTA